MKVYLLLHHEIFRDGKKYRTDEIVFHIVSSKEKALQAIKTYSVNPYSWWEIQEHTVDDPECNWPQHVGYYGLRGGKLKKQPYAKAVEAYKKLQTKQKVQKNGRR